MTVRFKCQSEYKKSYGLPRSRSVSPQRSALIAGLRSDQMGISREPCFQRRKRLGPGGLAQSCSSLLCLPSQQLDSHALKSASPAASRTHSANRKKASTKPNPPTSPEAQVHQKSAAEPETPTGPRPSADPEPGPTEESGTAEKSGKPHPSKPDSQSQLNQPLTADDTAQQPLANDVNHALRLKARLKLLGQRSGIQRSEYNRQFSWKKPIASASPLLTAEQVLYSSSRSVPPFKNGPVPVETEYRQSFQGVSAPTTGPRLRKHLEQQRIPLFHTHKTNKKKGEELQKKPSPLEEVQDIQANNETTPSPPQVQRAHRIVTEYESSFGFPLYRIPEEGGATDGNTPQVTELKQKALTYRQRAWGANFSRDHLSQLLSEHNTLWEPTDTTTDSATNQPSPCLNSDPSPDPDIPESPCVEVLDLLSHSSKRSSVVGSGASQHSNKNTQIKTPTHASPPAERRTAWAEGEEEENAYGEEGRLPTPRLKLLPVQRTHHDLTTPAAGGAILVGKQKGSEGSSPNKQQRCVSSNSKETWSENNSPQRASIGSSPNQYHAASPPSRTIRMKQSPVSPAAPPPLNSTPLHGIQGTLRHADFQHNGELGLRFRELPCSGVSCCSDEDDRLSLMSWRSAASCSMASAVLERAQKRRENFWGKR